MRIGNFGSFKSLNNTIVAFLKQRMLVLGELRKKLIVKSLCTVLKLVRGLKISWTWVASSIRSIIQTTFLNLVSALRTAGRSDGLWGYIEVFNDFMFCWSTSPSLYIVPLMRLAKEVTVIEFEATRKTPQLTIWWFNHSDVPNVYQDYGHEKWKRGRQWPT